MSHSNTGNEFEQALKVICYFTAIMVVIAAAILFWFPVGH